MKTATFIRLAQQITEYAPNKDYFGYVVNVVEPYKDQAADYYHISEFAVVHYAYQIAESLEKLGCVVIPEGLTD